MSLFIKNGTLVTAADTFAADLVVKDEKIVQIGQGLEPAPGARVIDATGKYVLPGGVDPHTHLDTPAQGTTTADDYLSGTIAAACGGTTTIVNFCFQEKGKSLASSLDRFAASAHDKAAIDYGFHSMISDPTDAVLGEIPSLPARGVTSIKMFMAYRGAMMVDDRALIRTLREARQHGILVMVHAETATPPIYSSRRRSPGAARRRNSTPRPGHRASRRKPPRVPALWRSWSTRRCISCT